MQSTLFDMNDVTTFPMSELVMNAVEAMASNNDPESRGAIYTRIEVVEFILDLARSSSGFRHRFSMQNLCRVET